MKNSEKNEAEAEKWVAVAKSLPVVPIIAFRESELIIGLTLHTTKNNKMSAVEFRLIAHSKQVNKCFTRLKDERNDDSIFYASSGRRSSDVIQVAAKYWMKWMAALLRRPSWLTKK